MGDDSRWTCYYYLMNDAEKKIISDAASKLLRISPNIDPTILEAIEAGWNAHKAYIDGLLMQVFFKAQEIQKPNAADETVAQTRKEKHEQVRQERIASEEGERLQSERLHEEEMHARGKLTQHELEELADDLQGQR